MRHSEKGGSSLAVKTTWRYMAPGPCSGLSGARGRWPFKLGLSLNKSTCAAIFPVSFQISLTYKDVPMAIVHI